MTPLILLAAFSGCVGEQVGPSATAVPGPTDDPNEKAPAATALDGTTGAAGAPELIVLTGEGSAKGLRILPSGAGVLMGGRATAFELPRSVEIGSATLVAEWTPETPLGERLEIDLTDGLGWEVEVLGTATGPSPLQIEIDPAKLSRVRDLGVWASPDALTFHVEQAVSYTLTLEVVRLREDEGSAEAPPDA